MCYSSYLYVYCIQSVINSSTPKSRSVISERSSLHLFFFVHVPDKIWVQEVGTRTNRDVAISVCRAQKQPMGDEKKDDGAGDPIKMLLKEALVRQRNEIMDNFGQILRSLPTREVGSYEDNYTRWTTLGQERDQTVPYFTNIFHTICTKLGIKDYVCHLVLKYYGCLHRYIQT
jgi:hypothetical protein